MNHLGSEKSNNPDIDMSAIRLEQVRKLAKLVLKYASDNQEDCRYAQIVIDSLPTEGEQDPTIHEQRQSYWESIGGQYIPPGASS